MTDHKIDPAQIKARPTLVHGPAPVESRPLTAERYISPEWMAAEHRQVWPKAWLVACLERDVAEAGEYQTFEIGTESVLIARTNDGELGAFYNVCQHRGARIMVNSGGWVKNFVCPYHGWTYDHGGRLTVVPDIERFSDGVDCDARSLKPVRVDTFAGLVFICLDPDAPSLIDYLGPVAKRIAPYRLEHMTLTEDQTVELDCNWKAVYDNFGELYHVEHIHPQHELIFDCPTAQIELFEHGHTGLVIDGHTVNTRLPLPEQPTPYHQMQIKKFGLDHETYVGNVLALRADVQARRREVGPSLGYDYDEFTDEQLTDIEQYNLFPNVVVTLQPDAGFVMRARPHPTDPNKCFWDKISFFLQPRAEVAEAAGVPFKPFDERHLEAIVRPKHDQFTQDDVIAGNKTMTMTIDQDIHLIRDIQKGMHSRGFDTTLLCDDEIRVQHYHDWLDHWMGVR